MFTLTSKEVTDNYYFAFIGIVFLFVGFIDLLHTFFYSDVKMFGGIGVSDLSTELWIFARYVGSVSLLIAPVFVNRKFRFSFMVTVYALISVFVFIVLFSGKNLPFYFIKDEWFALFKIISRYVICIILAGAAYHLLRKKKNFDSSVFNLLITSIIITVFSELFSTHYGKHNVFFCSLSHYLKIVSFYLIYKAVIVIGVREPTRTLFRKIKQDEEVMRTERERLTVILESMGDGIYIASRDYQIEYVNPVMKNEFGTIDGKKCYEYVYRNSEICPWCKNEQVFSGNSVHWEYENLIRGKIYDFMETPIKNPDGTLSKLVILRDITERKEAEEVLKRNKELLETMVNERTQKLLDMQKEVEMAKRLSDIGRLASTVAHELRNPLAAINVALANIKRKVRDRCIEQQTHTIEKKIVESDHIINNLLFYSRIREPYYEVVNIRDIIEECSQIALNQSKKQIAVIKVFNSAVFLEADPVQIREVFTNILNNACDAVADYQGKIEIGTKDISEGISIYVKDNGVGISAGDLENVMNPFFTTKVRGTGLGLAVCNQIVALHGGTISIESEPQQGATVYVNLPVKQLDKHND